jgi:hypothetical protein
MKIRFFLMMLMALSTIQSVRAATYHVAPQGSDAQPGTAHKPWQSLQHAATRVKAGDTVLLHGGIYTLKERVHLKISGRPDAWITFAAAPGEKPILDASGVRPANEGEAGWFGAITIEGPSYVRLVNLGLRNSYFAGIMVRGPGHHIDIAGCTVDMTFAPGIGAWNCSDFRVIGCEVTNANTQKMRLFGDPKHECPHEAISIAGVNRFEAAWNHVHHCEKEGIDVKEISRNGVVHHNYVHDMPRQGLYADAWFGVLENVEFASNVVHDCEWGLVISVEDRNSLLRNLRAHHNLLYRNRGSGLYFGTWGANGPRSDIRLENNTLYGNGKAQHWAGPTGNIDVRARDVRDLVVARNICLAGGAYEIATLFNPATEAAQFAALNIRIDDNVVASNKDDTNGPPGYGKPYVWPGTNVIATDPALNAPATGDFRPRAGSAAFTKPGYRGAFAPGARKLPDIKGKLSGFPRFKPSTPDTKEWPDVLKR